MSSPRRRTPPPFSLLLGFALLHCLVQCSTENRTLLFANVGDNVTLSCEGVKSAAAAVNWIWGPGAAAVAEVAAGGSGRFKPQPDGDLLIVSLEKEDSKEYLCQDAESNESLHTVLLQVRSVPPAVTNLTVAASSVYALVTWAPLSDDGGYPVSNFRLSYRRDKSHLSREEEQEKNSKSSYEWTVVEDLDANATSRTVYKLAPNSTYYFRICAVNKLGCGYLVSVMADTTFVAAEVDEAKKLLNQEEEESHSSNLKVWVIVTSGFFVTFAIIGFGISLLLIKNWGKRRSVSSGESTEEEAMELVPHITLNPSFNIEMLEFIEASEESHAHDEQEQLVQIDESEEINLVNSPLHHRSGSSNSLNRLNG